MDMKLYDKYANVKGMYSARSNGGVGPIDRLKHVTSMRTPNMCGTGLDASVKSSCDCDTSMVPLDDQTCFQSIHLKPIVSNMVSRDLSYPIVTIVILI